MSDTLDQLYNSVISASYENALKLTEVLIKNDQEELIKDLVTRLLNDGTDNIITYAYRLWIFNQKDLVNDYFPREFKLMFNGALVTFTDFRLGLPMKLNDVKEDYGDRKAYGDGHNKLSEAMAFRFITVYENNTLYFKIFNVKYNQYLKLVMKMEDHNDRRAFGSDDDYNKRHQWYLVPAMLQGKLLFYIINRQYDMALKLGDWVAPNKDRIVWGHNGLAVGQPGIFGWKIE